MRSRKLAWFLMLGLLIALAGCGSDGNGGGTMVMPDDPPPVDMEALEAAKAAAMTAYEEAKQAVADVEAHKSADMDSYDMAVAKRDEAKAANDKAQEAETVADAQKYRDMARTANMDAMTYADMVTTAAGTAADRAMAAAIAPAIADPDGDGVIVGVGQTDLQKDMRQGHNSENSANSTTFTVAAGGAVTVDFDGDATVIETDELDKDDMFDDNDTMKSVENQFMKQADAMRADLDGFAVSVHERTMDKVTDTLTVYTNVEDPTDQAYSAYFSSTNAGDATHSAGKGLSGASDTGVLNIANGEVAANHMLFSGPWFPTGSNRIADLPNADDASTPNITENEVEGMFRGVPGTYTCTGSTACRATNDKDGNLAELTGDWTFTPTVAEDSSLDKIMVAGVVPDADFLTFGYWLQATEQDDGSMKYGINTFYTGADTFTPITVNGTAEYSGKATGMYARKTFDSKGVGTPTSSGQFTADANLMANFGGPDVAQNRQNSISGTVSNFMDDSGNMIDDDWSVKLNEAEISTTDFTISASAGGTSRPATTTGGGSWQGSFYGNPMDADGTAIPDKPDTIAAENAPTSVAGEFNAHFSNGHVIGAFGATKK